MSRTPRPLAALAMVALVVAGCSSAPARDRQRRQRHHAAPRRHDRSAKAVKFAECMRDNGVSAFPDPDASGTLTIDAVANGSSLDTSTRGVQAGHQRVQGPGAAGVHGQQAGPPAAGGGPPVRPVHPRQRRDGLPRPRPNGPLVDTNRIPSSARAGWHEHSQRRDAEVPPYAAAAAGGHAVRRRTWAAGRSGRPGCRDRHRRRASPCPVRSRRPRPRSEPPANTATVRTGNALGHRSPSTGP